MNRDFKGVWIPKEIWLNKELSALDKVIFAEIDSLDNEENCTAGNDYLAEFCDCSERKVSDAVKKLTDLGYIEVVSFDGRHRKLRVAKNAKQGSKNCDSPSQNLQSINIDNNITNKGYNLSKDKLYENQEVSDYESHGYSKEDFLGSRKKVTRPRGKSLYSKCSDEIMLYTQDLQLATLLNQYLSLRLAMKDKPIYGVNQWKGLLDKLSKVIEDNPGMSYEDVVKQSIERGYASFFPVSSNKKKDISVVASEYGEVTCKRANEEDIVDEEF